MSSCAEVGRNSAQGLPKLFFGSVCQGAYRCFATPHVLGCFLDTPHLKVPKLNDLSVILRELSDSLPHGLLGLLVSQEAAGRWVVAGDHGKHVASRISRCPTGLYAGVLSASLSSLEFANRILDVDSPATSAR